MARGTFATVLILFFVGVSLAQSRPALPPELDLSGRFGELGIIPEAQGPRETCSLFAVTATANYEWARQQAGKHTPLATEFLVWAAKEACGKPHEQAMFYEALAGLNAFGLCADHLMPYAGKSGEHRKPTEEALRSAEPLRRRWHANWVKRWDLSRPMTDAQMAALRRALSDGHPVACGLRWPKSKEREGLLQPPPAGEVRDGHSIVLVGYRDDAAQPGGGVFRFRNSSGPNWGDHGHGIMSYAYVRQYANDAFWLELGGPESEVPRQRFEAEALNIAGADRCQAAPQTMDEWNPKLWSGGKQLLCTAETGGSLTLEFDVKEAGPYRVRVLATAAPDYGRIRAGLDGKDLPPVFDLRSGRVCPAGSLELGLHHLTAGRHALRLTLAGRGRRLGRSFGVDTLDLLPATSEHLKQ